MKCTLNYQAEQRQAVAYWAVLGGSKKYPPSFFVFCRQMADLTILRAKPEQALKLTRTEPGPNQARTRKHFDREHCLFLPIGSSFCKMSSLLLTRSCCTATLLF